MISFNLDNFRENEGQPPDDEFNIGDEFEINLTDKNIEEIEEAEKECECEKDGKPCQCPLDGKKKK